MLYFKFFGVLAGVVVASSTFIAPQAANAAAGALTPDVVKALFQKTVGATCQFEWKDIQIAPARQASIGEISAAGLPPHAQITPVRVEYTQVCHPGYTRDYRWNYYFYKDDFGGWAKQSNATTGNYGSQPR